MRNFPFGLYSVAGPLVSLGACTGSEVLCFCYLCIPDYSQFRKDRSPDAKWRSSTQVRTLCWNCLHLTHGPLLILTPTPQPPVRYTGTLLVSLPRSNGGFWMHTGSYWKRMRLAKPYATPGYAVFAATGQTRKRSCPVIQIAFSYALCKTQFSFPVFLS